MSEYINGRKSLTTGNAILIADAFNISLDNLAGRKWNTCCDHKKPGAYTGEYTGEYTDELRETLHKLAEKECIFVMDVIKALKQHLQWKKAGARSSGLINIYIYIIFLWYHFSPVPFLYDYIPEPARTNLIFSRAFYLTVPFTYHIRSMYAPCPSAKKRFYTECWGVLKSTLPTFFSL